MCFSTLLPSRSVRGPETLQPSRLRFGVYGLECSGYGVGTLWKRYEYV